MTISAGTRLGPYEILSPLGAGGMGEVYRARDTRLGREVAIKVLSSAIASSPEHLRRFEQEARSASALSDPHIVTVHDVGEQDGIHYFASELVEGGDLRSRLGSEGLSSRKVLEIAEQIASGLASAHEKGITHRDLKPENILLTKSGQAKIADFGLAKLSETPDSDVSQMPTADRIETTAGVVMGTVSYMSPEQAAGRKLDYRSDQFSFGLILYEMLTGKLAFRKDTQGETLAAILRDEPRPVTQLNPSVPAPVVWLVERCLAKDPAERYSSTRDLAREISGIRRHLSEAASMVSGVPVAANSRIGGRERALWVSATAALAVLAAAAVVATRRPAASSLRVSILPPAGSVRVREISLSPDGRSLALIATDTEGKDALFVRPLNSASAKRLPGTEDAFAPFWSPDSRWVGFVAGEKLQKIEVDGGRPEVICDGGPIAGGTWASDGTILFGSFNSSIRRVPASGGAPVEVTPAPKGAIHGHFWPHFLPDGRHFLYLDQPFDRTKSWIVWASVDGKETRRLVMADSIPLYASGRLVDVESGGLTVRRFDPGSGRLSGEPVLVGEGVADNDFGEFLVSASDTDALAYGTTDRLSRLTWFDRSGKELGTVGPAAEYVHVELAPSDALAVLERIDRNGDNLDLVDLARGALSRFTFDAGEHGMAVFCPDGSRIAYLLISAAKSEIYEKSVDGAGAPRLLYTGGAFPSNWTPDGGSLVVETWSEATKADIGVLSLGGGRTIQPIVQTGAWEYDGRVSPDGKWLAYCSDASGRPEVYVQDFPDARGKWQISISGGFTPRWRADGRELTYQSAAGIFGVEVARSDSFSPATPRLLIPARVKSYRNRAGYALTRDGQRFLAIVEPPAAPITYLANWSAGLPR